MNGQDIMYVGLQFAQHWDRVNKDMSRIFNGPGDIARGVGPIQAAKLLSVGTKEGSPEYIDVTKLSEEEKLEKAKAVYAAAEEEVRKLKAPAGVPGNEKNIDAMSDDELQAELERRQRQRGLAASGPKVQTTQSDANPQGVEKTDKKLQELGAQALERILAKAEANPDLLDENGLPTHAALQEEMGVSITEDEYRVALGL